MTATTIETGTLPDVGDVLDDDDGHRHGVCPRCYPPPIKLGTVVTVACGWRYVYRPGEPVWDKDRPDCRACVEVIHITGCARCGKTCGNPNCPAIPLRGRRA